MNNINYNKDFLCKYDSSFNKNYFFENEFKDNIKYKKINQTRKIICNANISKYIFLRDLKIEKLDNGFKLSFLDRFIYLVITGKNILFLANISKIDILSLHSMIHTFLLNNNYYIDISKYPFLFKNFNTLSIYKIIN